jgi:hypothetical protein
MSESNKSILCLAISTVNTAAVRVSPKDLYGVTVEMKPFNAVLKTLIKINILTAIAALITFVIVREYQSALMNSQQKQADEPLTYRSSVRKNPAETARREEVERSRMLARKLQEAKGELAKKQEKIRELIAQGSINTPDRPDRSSLSPEQSPVHPAVTATGSPSPLRPSESIVPTMLRVSNRDSIEAERNRSTPTELRFAQTASNQNHQERAMNPTAPHDQGTHQTASVRTAKTSDIAPSTGLQPQEIASSAPSDTVSPSFPQALADSPSQSRQDSDIAENTTLAIVSFSFNDRERSPERQENPRTASDPRPYPAKTGASALREMEKPESIRIANDIAFGLIIAGDKGQINYGTTSYRRVQTAIRLLRQGEDIDNAARRSTLSAAVLHQLIKWGENRPGNLAALNDSSHADPN